MIFLEGGIGTGAVALILLIMASPAIILIIIGFILRRLDKSKAAKIFFILGILYLVIGLGACFSTQWW